LTYLNSLATAGQQYNIFDLPAVPHELPAPTIVQTKKQSKPLIEPSTRASSKFKPTKGYIGM
jgi:hypothetical protein